MKNLITKLTLIALVIAVCGTASAAFTDDPNTLALYHCDATNWVDAAVTTTPDDNTSGRTAHDLNLKHANEVVMMPGSPYGGSYLAFDGTDRATVFGVLSTPPTILKLDVAFRANTFPDSTHYKSLLWTYPLKVYLFGSHVRLLVYDAAGNPYFMDSTMELTADTWYTASAVASNNALSVVVGNDAEGYTTTTRVIGDDLLDSSAADYVAAGWDPFDGSRDLDGDLDELRVSLPIPEPATLGLLGLLGLFAIRRK